MPLSPIQPKLRRPYPRLGRPKFFAGSSEAPIVARRRSARSSKPRYRWLRRCRAAIAAWPGPRAHRAPTTIGRRKAEQPRWRQTLSIAARHLLFCAPPIKPAPLRAERCQEPALWTRVMRLRPPPERPQPGGARSGQNGRRYRGVPIPMPLKRRQHPSAEEARANRTRSQLPVGAPVPAPTRRAAPGRCWRLTLAHPQNGRFGIQRDPMEAP